MTSEHEPGRDEWRPWGGSDAHAEQSEPGSSPERPADEAAPTQATRRIPFDEPLWATVQGGPLEPGTTERWAGRPHASHHADTAPAPPPYVGSHLAPAVPEPARTRRGPGWGALVGVAAAAALVAGTVGGLVGGTLAEGGALQRTAAPAPSAGVGAVTRPEGSVANIAAKATPSVVTLRVDGSDGEGTGSGWVYDASGHIVTNNHVVAGADDSGDVTVILANGQQLGGTVVGRDASYDLAVLKVDRTDLAPLTLGRSEDVVVGDQVIAVGAPLGLDSTVTSGIVSALNRPVTPGDADDQSFINAIQTDAAINPGNSGGPLLDMQGRVIGVNSAIARAPGSGLSGQSGNIGVGFAIPSDQVSTTVTQLIATGKAVHPVIGVYLDPEYTGEGVRIADEGPDGEPAVSPGGPADDAGLEPGDVVLAFEGRPVSEDGELVVAIRARAVGDRVTLTIRRGGTERDVTMVLEGSGD